MKYAWIENNTVRDIAPGTPAEYYHADVAKFYSTEIPDTVERGASLVDGIWVNPEPVATPASSIIRTWTADDFRSGMTLSEKVRWDNNNTPEIVTAKIEVASPQELQHTTEILDMLVSSGDISQATKDKILT